LACALIGLSRESGDPEAILGCENAPASEAHDEVGATFLEVIRRRLPCHPSALPQSPFAAILGCSDSRVPPELVFDQGLGDLYVVRVAGNLADRLAIASLELAVEGLGVRLIVVLGHDQCAAVARTIKMLGLGARRCGGGMWNWQHDWAPASTRPIGHFSELANALKPAVDEAYHRAGNLTDAVIDANIRRVVDQLKASQPILAAHVTQSGLRIVGARYSLASGIVTFAG